MAPVNDPFALIDACCEARDNPNWQATEDGTTFCNQAVCYIANRVGCDEIPEGLLANDIIDKLSASVNFKQVPMGSAQGFANSGQLVIAGLKAQPHGHVCVVRPGVVAYSNKWQMNAPKVVNVGAKNFIGQGVNWSFAQVPTFFLWAPIQVGG